ncbi:MAG: glutamate-1-semialdehyde 2,1-aminomutase [Bacteroidota bacterium]
MINNSHSSQAFTEAQKYIPGGVNSPARSFKNTGIDPLFIDSAKGSKITDIDGNTYIDYVASWGPAILGHAHDEVLAALSETMHKGISFGAPTEIETQIAELITNMVPSVDLVRMVNSGTEATMSAVRLARGYTKRDKIIKFEGCYHGHGDSFLIQAGSGALTHGNPNSPGVTKGVAQDTLLAKYNDIQSVESLFQEYPEKIAGIIIEPVTGNMGVIVPQNDFLMALRNLCTQYGALLIFDEVMTGFRLSSGGAQKRFNIIPDLTCFGKIIGGGMPVGAYGGKKEIMDYLAPNGPVYQAGTLSGNPLAMAVGYTTLQLLNSHPEWYEQLEKSAEILEAGIRENISTVGIPIVCNRVGSMFTQFFTDQPAVHSFTDVSTCNIDAYMHFFRTSLQEGVYYAPSQYEAAFLGLAHSQEDIEKTISAHKTALQSVKKELYDK